MKREPKCLTCKHYEDFCVNNSSDISCKKNHWDFCPFEKFISKKSWDKLEKNDFCNTQDVLSCWDCKYVKRYTKKLNECIDYEQYKSIDYEQYEM